MSLFFSIEKIKNEYYTLEEITLKGYVKSMMELVNDEFNENQKQKIKQLKDELSEELITEVCFSFIFYFAFLLLAFFYFSDLQNL